MADNNHPGAVADRTDTGQWRLEVRISRTGVKAMLHAIDRPGVSPRTILDMAWPDDGEQLLTRISNAVYDHPQVLDDYSALIIIDTPLVTWVPSDEDVDDSLQAETFTAIYGGEKSDVLVDEDETRKGPAALYSLTPGLKGFLARTFPGARIRCAQAMNVRRLACELPEGDVAAALMRDGATDVVVMRDGELLCAATRPEMAPADTAYHLLYAATTTGVDPATAQIRLDGTEDRVRGVGDLLCQFCAEIRTL